jgi:hypothetical protein
MKLSGRILDIVVGRSGMSVADVGTYRDRLLATGVELPPMDNGAAPLSSVGTFLHAVIARETGTEVPCDACAEMISALDRMTAAEATTRKSETVEVIYSRAWGHAGWKNKIKLLADMALAVSTGGKLNVGKDIIGGWFDEALTNGKDPADSKKKDTGDGHREPRAQVVNKSAGCGCGQ